MGHYICSECGESSDDHIIHDCPGSLQDQIDGLLKRVEAMERRLERWRLRTSKTSAREGKKK
jgi:hypothetical protein